MFVERLPADRRRFFACAAPPVKKIFLVFLIKTISSDSVPRPYPAQKIEFSGPFFALAQPVILSFV
jgi:hypothetical protein